MDAPAYGARYCDDGTRRDRGVVVMVAASSERSWECGMAAVRRAAAAPAYAYTDTHGTHLQRRRVGADRRDDDRVVDGLEEVGRLLGRIKEAALVEVTRLAQNLGEARDRRLLLADADVDAVARLRRQQLVGRDLLLVVVLCPAQALVEEGLVDDRVDRDGRLARLAVADDELALAEADGHHRVDAGDASQQRLVDGLAVHDAGRVRLHGAAVAELQVAREVEAVAGVNRRRVELERAVLVIDRHAERVEHAAKEARADVDGDNTLAREDAVADLDKSLVTENHDGSEVALETDDHAVDVVDGGGVLLHRLQSCWRGHEDDELAEGGEAQVAREGDAVLDTRHDAEGERLHLLLAGLGRGCGLRRETARHLGGERSCVRQGTSVGNGGREVRDGDGGGSAIVTHKVGQASGRPDKSAGVRLAEQRHVALLQDATSVRNHTPLASYAMPHLAHLRTQV